MVVPDTIHGGCLHTQRTIYHQPCLDQCVVIPVAGRRERFVLTMSTILSAALNAWGV